VGKQGVAQRAITFASDVKSKCHDSFMTEEQIVERFEEIQDEIDVYTKRIETLEEDVEILAKFATSQIIAY
jgi:hypothetical protein